MADLWYYSHDKKKIGPCSSRRMKELAAAGGILPTDVVWKEGIEQGVAASKVKHLFAPMVPVVVVPPSDPLAEIPAARAEAPPCPVPEPTEARAEAVPAVPVPPVPPVPSDAPPVDSSWQAPARKGRATAGRGAILVGQDGVNVKVRKKCTTCNHVDPSWTTMPIRNGTMRIAFYCPKCRKSRDVEVNGSLI